MNQKLNTMKRIYSAVHWHHNLHSSSPFQLFADQFQQDVQIKKFNRFNQRLEHFVLS